MSKVRRMHVLLLAALAVGALAVAPAGALDANEHINVHQDIKGGNCASGTFRAAGVITDKGIVQSCDKFNNPPSVLHGTANLHGRYDYTLHWKCQVDRKINASTYQCDGQWFPEDPWTGGGNVTLRLDFAANTADFQYVGDLG